MIQKKKNNFFFIFFIIWLIVIIFSFFLIFNNNFFYQVKEDLKQKIMTLDHGFSSIRTILYLEENYLDKNIHTNALIARLFRSLTLKFSSYPERPSIEMISISIKFKNYQKILDDRNRGIKERILGSEKNEVNCIIEYKGKKYPAKIRIKGDFPDHWQSLYRMSFRVNLKKGAIFGFKKFSIQKPISRQHPYDQVHGEVARNLGIMSPIQTYAYVVVNGQKWGIMNIEEHVSKEFLEKQKRKDSIIVKFGTEKLREYKLKSQNAYKNYRLDNREFDVMLLGKKKDINKKNFRLWLSYIVDKRVKNESSIFDIDKFSKSYLLASFWGNLHALHPYNSRYYFNPYTLKIEPILTDANYASEINLKNPTYKILENPYDKWTPYDELIGTKEYKKNLKKNLNIVKNKLKKTREYMSYYQSFFPSDDLINVDPVLNKNIKIIEKDENYHSKKNTNTSNYNINEVPTKEDAKYFPEHVYAKHFTDGSIHIYNRLPDDVNISKIFYNDNIIYKNLLLKGFKKKNYSPLELKTDIIGIADRKILIVTEYKKQIRKHIVDISLIPGPYFNPMTDLELNENNFLKKKSDNSWLIKKGKWNISKPIVLKGKIIIEPGTKLIFDEKSYIIVRGQLIAQGQKDEKIILTSNNNWKGIYVIGNREDESILNNVIINKITALEDGLLQLTGGVNFYNSIIKIQDTEITNSLSEDALNIINSKFLIQNLKINDTFSDGFDSDHSNGDIYGSTFFNIGGDAIDFSGSNVNIFDTNFENIRDKAVSVGEATNAKLRNIIINNIGVGVASKDGSNVKIQNLKIQNYKLAALMTYNKKDFYEHPYLEVDNIEIPITPKKTFIAQENSKMIIDNKNIDTEKLNIKKLYQTDIMKK